MCITFFCLYPFRSKPFLKSSQEASSNIQSLKDQQNTQNNSPFIQQHKISYQQPTERKQQVQFIIAFNRDQQSNRKTIPFAPFSEDPNIYAGRDTVSTGTWLGVNIKTGIMVILTNYDIPIFRKGKSRGQLVKYFLSTNFLPPSNQPVSQNLDELIKKRLSEILVECNQVVYPAFNLIVYNIRSQKMHYICSETKMKQAQTLKENQIYSLCNTDLYTLWPKSMHGLSLFEKTLVEIKDKQDSQIFDKLINTVMKDKKQFSQNLNDEASIFIEPFFSTLENAERMTKSTFAAVIRRRRGEKGENEIEIVMRQVTHENSTVAQVKELKDIAMKENKQLIEGYDHSRQTIVQYKLKL